MFLFHDLEFLLRRHKCPKPELTKFGEKEDYQELSHVILLGAEYLNKRCMMSSLIERSVEFFRENYHFFLGLFVLSTIR